MNNENGISILLGQLERILTFWERELVRDQLIAILIALLTIVLVERAATVLFNRWAARQMAEIEDSVRPIHVRIAALLQRLLLPALGLVLYILLVQQFGRQQRLNGLIEDMVEIFWLIFYFRIAIAVGYELFDSVRWRRIHYRLLAPLFWIYIVGRALGDFINWRRLADYVLGGAAENPLTLGTLVVAVAALYFWTGSVIQFQGVAQAAIVSRTNAREGSIEAGLTLVRYLLLLVGIYLFLLGIGLNSTTIAAITGGLSVGIGFGLQSVISNFVSGIILLFEGAIRPGDALRYGGQTVDVKKMGIRATTVVRRYDKVKQIIPNSDLFENTVSTLTGFDPAMRVRVVVRASYNDDPDAVIAALTTMASTYSRRLPDKQVVCQLKGFAESAIDYDLSVWFDSTQVGPNKVVADLHLMIHKTFAEHGFEMPFEQQHIHLRRSD